MLKKVLRTFTALFMSLALGANLLLVGVMPVKAFSSGDGSASNPFLVSSAADLENVRSNLNACYKQTCDIDLSGNPNWTKIGEDLSAAFFGTYDGAGHKITGLTITDSTKYAGLFGVLGSGGTVKNLGVSDASVTSNNDILGILVGFNNTGGIVENCYSTGTVTTSKINAGGLIGSSKGTVSKCYSAARVTANGSSSTNIGGLIGYSLSNATPKEEIRDCYSTGNVTNNGTTSPTAGGFVGSAGAPIYNCYSTGRVTCNNGAAGGFAGKISGGTFTDCYFDSETSGTTSPAPVASSGITAKNTLDMQDPSTFLGGNWNATTIWKLENGKYPKLQWEIPPAAPEMDVTGNGKSIASGDTSPSLADHTDFGGAGVGGTVSRTFTVCNTGSADLNLSGSTMVSISGTNASDFTVSKQPTTLVAATNGTTSFDITFTPKGLDSRTATVSIDNNDSDEHPYTFSICGTGLSSDNGLTSVAGQMDGNPAGDGGSSISPATWSISVPNSKDTLARSDIAVAKDATVQLYSDSGFSTEVTGTDTISLAEGAATTAYIKVTAADKTSVKYYAVTINRASPPPTVTLSISPASIDETGGIATVTATLSHTCTSNVIVDLGYTGTATAGTDYTASGTTISIPAGSLTGTATITAKSDTLDEDDETVIVDITNVTNGTESGDQQKTVTITDDNTPPTISVNNPSVVEGNSGTTDLIFTITLSEASGKPVSVDYATADDTAKAGSDYVAIPKTALTFTPGETSKKISVAVKGDTDTEPDETLKLNLSGAINASIADGQGIGTGTITNDEALPAIAVNDATLAEGNSGTTAMTFTVTLDRTSASLVTVNYATENDSAVCGEDYTSESGTLSFAAGETSKSITINVSGDNKFETDESFFVKLSTPSNGTIGDAQGVGTITNDDSKPSVTLSAAGGTMSETGGNMTLTATLSNPSYQPITVDLGYTGTAKGGGTDYTASGTTIAIPAGSLTGTATITAKSDTLDEDDETVIVDITGVTNGTESGDQQKTVTITDDDTPPTISINDPSVVEGDSGTTNLIFTVTLSAASGKTVSVEYETADDTATQGADYVAIPKTALTFAPSETSKTVSITINGDLSNEANETVLLNLKNPTNATIAKPQATGTITNDDGPPLFSIDDVTHNEGNTGSQVYTFTVSLNKASGDVLTLDYATQNDSAVSGEDYTPASGTLSFGLGETSKSITVNVSGDNKFETDESFFVNLSNPSKGTIGDAQGVGTITNDDSKPSVTLSAAGGTMSETGGNMTLTATLSNPSYQPITVDLGYTGTAKGGGTDYTASGTTIAIPAGSLTGTATIIAKSDTLDEDDETVIVDITNVTNGTESGDQQKTVTITDDDTPPTISINDPSVTEGNSGTATLLFVVTLSSASGKTVAVDFASADGTAKTSDLDYINVTGTLTFTPGELTKQISVPVKGDTRQESNETVLLNLTNPKNATVTDAQGSGTISDDDTVTNSGGSTSQGSGSSSSQGSGSSSSQGSGGGTPQMGAVVEVNGQKQDAGSVHTQTTGGQTVTTITVDDTKLNTILDNKGVKPTVTLHISTTSNVEVAVGELNGQTLKNMEKKEATLEIKTGTASYKLPASEINIDAVSAQMGPKVELKDIKVSIKIAEPPADTVKIVEDTAKKKGYLIVVKPVEFEISCKSGDKTVDVSKFNGYVERMVAIPDGVDPNKITTGIVLNSDGSFRHVPTKVTKIDNKYFAKINSLTNSTYSVVWNPVEFTDVAHHWAKSEVNNMGSRMVVTGVGSNTYEPDRSITRAEFAAIVARAMGLANGTTESSFHDVSRDDWFNGYVDTATAYELVKGKSATSYNPNDLISREEAMVILERAMKKTGLSVNITDSEVGALLSKYSDAVDVSDYAKSGVASCLKSGFIAGRSANTLSPKDNVSRAEVAVMVQRLLQQSGLI